MISAEHAEHQQTHKELKEKKDLSWDDQRQENRLHNLSLAHGLINFASGQHFVDHGVLRPKAKK